MTKTKVCILSRRFRCLRIDTWGLQVVVKAADKFETEGLAREIYHHRRLRHPHITRLYEVIHTEKNVWLVLEYCHGESPFSLLCPFQPLMTPVNRRRIIRFSPQEEAVKGTRRAKDVCSTRRRRRVHPQVGMCSSRPQTGEHPARQERKCQACRFRIHATI